MTQLTKRRNGNSGLFPSLNDFFANRLFTPPLFDPDDDLFSTDMGGPPVNISETDKEFKLDLSVPGMNKEDFKVDIENGILTVSSEKEEEKEKEERNYTRREFLYSSFSRSFTLPDNVEENDISAKYDNGMLEIVIPKKEVTVSKPKKEISVT